MRKIWQNGEPVYVSRVNREWSSEPNVMDIATVQRDNQFLVKLAGVGGDYSLSRRLMDLGGNAIPDVSHSAP